MEGEISAPPCRRRQPLDSVRCLKCRMVLWDMKRSKGSALSNIALITILFTFSPFVCFHRQYNERLEYHPARFWMWELLHEFHFHVACPGIHVCICTWFCNSLHVPLRQERDDGFRNFNSTHLIDTLLGHFKACPIFPTSIKPDVEGVFVDVFD